MPDQGSAIRPVSPRRSGGRRRSRIVLFAICSALAAVVLTPSSGIGRDRRATASVAYPPLPPPARKPGWWAGTCDKNRTPGSFVGPSWHGLVACGPGSTGNQESTRGPLSANVEWQCVDLVERWLYLEFGIKQVVSVPGDPVQGTNGFQLVRHYAYQISKQFRKGHYPLTEITPAVAKRRHDASLLGPGDVVSYGTSYPGHTDVVEKSTVGPGGNGEILTLNQNLPMPKRPGVDGPVEKWFTVTNWTFSDGYGASATAWLHVTGNTKHQEAPPPPEKTKGCPAPPPFPSGPGHPVMRVKGVSCGYARLVVVNWNNRTGNGGACKLDGSSCRVLSFDCRMTGANLQTLLCTRSDGSEIRLDIGPY